MDGAKATLNSLCTAVAILVMHLNTHWGDFVENMASELSENVDHVTALLLIIKYMADICDNDSIVIEDSIRQSFFNFMDNISQQIFEGIFNYWAGKLLQSGLGVAASKTHQSAPGTAIPTDRQEIEALKLQRLRSKLVDAFYCWIKLRLPDQVLETLTTNCASLIQLVFAELETNKDENLENATNCVIELISVARKKANFSSIKQAVISKVEHLIGKVDQAVAENDEELGEQLMDIFVELGRDHAEQIIDHLTLTIPTILLKLMKIPNIQTRRQVTFWKTLFKCVEKIENPEVKR
jgi:hypothetical protein